MINSFNENECRKSAIIYNSTFEQIKQLYAVNPVQAGELAISAFELALTGQISSDDFYVKLMLENIKVVNEESKAKYDKKVEAQKQKKISEQQLDVIAAYYLNGMKQKDIAIKIGTTPQTISNRLATIRADFPELLEKNQVNQVNQSNQVYDNVNDNDNENDNMDRIDAKASNLSRGFASARPAKELTLEEKMKIVGF